MCSTELTTDWMEWLASQALAFDPTNFDPIAKRLDRAAWPASEWGDRWLVSPFWFDAKFLALSAVKTLRPRERAYYERFLEAKSQVLAPTFVIARRGEGDRLPIQNPKFAWHSPIGRDTPILWVDDFKIRPPRSTRSSPPAPRPAPVETLGANPAGRSDCPPRDPV